MAQARVVRCEVSDCAYNRDHACHALAITVGEKAHPQCGTCFRSKVRGGDERPSARVGACHMDHCMFNQDLECQAPHIRVGHLVSDADCTTFTLK